MYKKAQILDAFSSMIMFIFAVLIYFLGFAKFVNNYMDEKVALGSIGGFEGFFLANFNFFVAIICIMILLIMARLV